MLIVDDNTNLDKVPAYLADEKLLQISKVSDKVQGNLHTNEIIHMTGNKWYRLRISMVDPAALPAKISFGEECEVRKVANDGVWLSTVPAEPNNDIWLTGASRADVAIKCQDESTITHTTLSSDSKTMFATIKVKGFDSDTPDPTPWKPRRPNSLMLDGKVAGNYTVTMTYPTITNSPYDINKPITSIASNRTQEWTLIDTAYHPLHLHLYHVQVVTPGGCGNHDVGQFYDTISWSDPCKVRSSARDSSSIVIF